VLNDANNIYGSLAFVRSILKNTIELEKTKVVARETNFLGLLFNDTYF
jgi:hypothetical protein